MHGNRPSEIYRTQRTTIVRNSTYIRSLDRQIHQDRKQDSWSSELEGSVGSRGGKGSPCLMAIERLLGMMEKVWEWILVTVTRRGNTVNVLNATEPHAYG